MLHPKPKYRRHKRRAKRDPDAQEACIERDGRCMWCGRIDDTLVGHHMSSFGASGDDSLHNMITLCGRCHNTVGQGYLLISCCNHPAILAAQPGLVGVASKVGSPPKIWRADEVLKGIVEEAYG